MLKNDPLSRTKKLHEFYAFYMHLACLLKKTPFSGQKKTARILRALHESRMFTEKDLKRSWYNSHRLLIAMVKT